MIFAIVGCLITIGLGVLGFIRPLAAANIVSLRPEGKLGMMELRSSFGGLYIGIGLFALISQQRLVFFALAALWAGIGLSRAAALILERAPSRMAFFNIGFELVMAALFLLPF